jgi:uncharacterized protein (TIGR02444 family)
MRQMRSAGPLPLELEGAQWSFALSLYGRPGIADACLLLQERLGADVCLLLFALFLAREHGAVLEASDLESLDCAIANWRREVIYPLRSVRRRMRSGPQPAPGPATEPLRQQIKAAEIRAEQIELAALAHMVDMRALTRSASPLEPAVLIDRLAGFFAARCDNSKLRDCPEIRVAMKTIAGAMAE